MKKMKVVLTAINSRYIHSNLAVKYLKTYTEDLDYTCEIREFSINDRIERVLEELIKEKPDVIAFSCYIWNIEFVKKVVKLIKLVNNNIEIIYGGPEVSFDVCKFLCDNDTDNGEYVIEGEGEKTYRELIEYKISNISRIKCVCKQQEGNKESQNYTRVDDLKKIKGLYFTHSNRIYYGGVRDRININDIAFPYRSEDDLDNKIVYYEASRGCPFGCKYCLSSVDRKLRFRDIEKVKKELGFFINKKVRIVKFVDRTFNCNKQFAMEIWKFLIDQDTETTFHFEISANLLTEEEIKLLSKAPKKRIQFEVGVQTTNNEILSNINRKVNFEDIKEKVLEVQKMHNILQHLDLIAGLPGENIESFKKSFNDVYSMQPEEIQLGFLKILKGSPMMKEHKKWGMVYSPYPPYEILKTNDISYEEILILKKVEVLVDKYYNSGKFKTILKYFTNQYSSYFDFYYELSLFFKELGYYDRNISSTEYYRVFLLFNSEKLRNDNKVLKNIVKYDYLKFNKKKWIPDFLDRDVDKSIKLIIKEKVEDENLGFEKNKFHIDNFDIDIFEYIQNGSVIFKNVYLIFDEFDGNNIKQITL